MAAQRKFRIEYAKGKKDVKESVSAENAADALRRAFPGAGAVKLTPAETIHYHFEVEIEGGGTVKGEVYQARRIKDGSADSE
jgi:hypothetical protein